MVLLFAIGLVFGIVCGYAWATRKRKPPFLLQLEYWVYLPGEAMPPQDETMTRLIDSGAIGAPEALLFSDVRLHVALVLRSKNAHVFRPDLLAPYVDATPEQLATLAAAKSLAKIRFLSEQPVSDRRYLRFLPQLARTVAALGDGSLVYDPVGERLLSPEALRKGDPGPNVRWVAAPSGGHVETLGLKKVGLGEIRTYPIPADERWIATEVVELVAAEAWKKGELSPSVDVHAFEDRFRIDLTVEKDGVASARIHRIQAI